MNKENCTLKLIDEIILYHDARSKKHQIFREMYTFNVIPRMRLPINRIEGESYFTRTMLSYPEIPYEECLEWQLLKLRKVTFFLTPQIR